MAVARVGAAQLECATASEPLYFAHANISDEYALPLPTGDAMLDGFPFRVFLSDPESGATLARINHRAGDLVLHPHGFVHWPGKLRAPFAPPAFPPGARRAVLSLVCCASRPTPPSERPLFVAPGREPDAKAYVDPPPPLLLAPLASAEPGALAAVGESTLELAEPPFVPERGGYVVVLEASAPAFACDLVYVPPGARYEGEGVTRALLFESKRTDADPPPASWERVPLSPFPPFEDGPPGRLPFRYGGLTVEEADEGEVEVRVEGEAARVPRYWLARTLFRLGLHPDGLGYVETYGGFAYDDHGGIHRLGLRGAGMVEIAEGEWLEVLEALYRAVAPANYTEALR